jgi:glycosyltransferase involved in cell wall biosynthesis
VGPVHGINEMEAQVDPRGGALKGGLRVALWGFAERQCLRRASDVVVISPFVRQVIAPRTDARLHTIENPVHDAFFGLEPAPEPGKVLMVGAVKRSKGTLEAIQAIARVRQQVPHARLYVAGGFAPAYREYGERVRGLASEMGAGGIVHFLGQVGHETLLEAYRTSQVLLFPTYIESSSVSLAEAMAAGLPSVVSDIPGTAHMIHEGISGWRVPVGDVGALAERVVRLLQNPESCSRMGQHAREHALAHSSAESAARKTRDLYHALASLTP